MVGETEEARQAQIMRGQFSGNDRSLFFPVLTVLGICILTILGLQYIADHGRATGYYLTGNVVSAGEKNFCMTAISEESNVDLPLSTDVYCFELKDFQSKCSLPEMGDVVRITCSHDMTVLIGIYNVDDLPD